MNLYQVAEEIARRLERIFLRDESGRRPVFGDAEKYQADPHWRDHIWDTTAKTTSQRGRGCV
jgi:hypothetical protein